MKALCIYLFYSLFLVTISSNIVSAQKANVIYRDSEFFSYEEGKSFEFLHENYDISNHLLVARLSGLVLNKKKRTLKRVYESIGRKAKYIGANTYRIDTIIGARTDSVYFEVSIYQLTEAELDMNYDMFSDNTIYLIGELKRTKSGEESFKLNAEDATINNLEYLEFPLDEGEELKLNKGGYLCTQVVFVGQEDRKPAFVSFSGVSIAPTANYQSVGISFSAGSIYPIDMSFGYFLIQVLKKGN